MEQEKQVRLEDAIIALNKGKRIKRAGWNGENMFIFKQIPSQISLDIVPRMQSLPNSVKNAFIKRLEEGDNNQEFLSIRYENQLCLVSPDNVLYGYVFSGSDALANDWIVLDTDLEDQNTFSEPVKVGPPPGGHTFGQAVDALKEGHRVFRAGWNGKGMYLYYVPASTYPAQTEAARIQFGDTVPYREYLALKTAQNDVATWSPSSSDVLANDWIIYTGIV